MPGGINMHHNIKEAYFLGVFSIQSLLFLHCSEVNYIWGGLERTWNWELEHPQADPGFGPLSAVLRGSHWTSSGNPLVYYKVSTFPYCLLWLKKIYYLFFIFFRGYTLFRIHPFENISHFSYISTFLSLSDQWSVTYYMSDPARY